MPEFENDLKIVIGYPILLLILMWSIYLMDWTSGIEFYEFGIYPRSLYGLIGVFTAPLIHSQEDIKHILGNSLPIVLLLSSLIHFYRSIAAKIFIIIWLFGGLMTWTIARENYHIGMSGVIYGLLGFLFTSGALRKYKPLMGLSLFVVFLYGSLIWGIFPMEKKVSWEGHLSGLFVGVLSAFIYRKEGPQSPKFQYEIDKELGIEPIDYEKLWREKLGQEEEEKRAETQTNDQEASDASHTKFHHNFTYKYSYKPNNSPDDTSKTPST
jgi:membrane associated rhomboid family serine protease